MKEKLFISASELAEMLEISRSHAYKIINKLNKQLDEMGYMTLTVKVSRKYFQKKFYGTEVTE